jgi:hypothetical protein
MEKHDKVAELVQGKSPKALDVTRGAKTNDGKWMVMGLELITETEGITSLG